LASIPKKLNVKFFPSHTAYTGQRWPSFS